MSITTPPNVGHRLTISQIKREGEIRKRISEIDTAAFQIDLAEKQGKDAAFQAGGLVDKIDENSWDRVRDYYKSNFAEHIPYDLSSEEQTQYPFLRGIVNLRREIQYDPVLSEEQKAQLQQIIDSIWSSKEFRTYLDVIWKYNERFFKALNLPKEEQIY